MEQVEAKHKQTDIGWIPYDWEVTPIDDILNFEGGSQPPRDTFIFEEQEGYLRLLQIRDYKTDKYASYIPLHLARKKCEKDDIMIGRYGPPIFQILRGFEGAYNVALIKAIPKQKITKEFGWFVLTQERLFEFVEKLSQRSSGQTGVDLNELKKYQIPLPPTIEEQTAISTALSNADNYITSLEKLIAKKRLIKQGAMQELLKPKEGWVELSLGECLIRNPEYGINAPATAYLDTLPTYLRITDISENGKFLSENKVSVNHPLSEHFYLKKGDLVFARTGASVGKTYLYDENDGKLVFAGFLIRVAINPEKLNPILLKNLTETKKYWDWVKLMSMRSGQPGINGNEYKQFPFYLPSTMEEQNRIATILDEMDTEIVSLEKKLEKAKHIKQGMMQQLLTGKIRMV